LRERERERETRLERQISELCPSGIKYFVLNDIDDLTMGTSPKGNTISTYPSNGIEFHQGKTFFGEMILQNSNTYTTDPIKFANAGSVIMSVRAPVGDSNLVNRNIAIGRGLCSMACKDSMINKFLYYWIKSNIYEFKQKSSGSTFESINTDAIKSIKIPVPPLPIQEEITRILDKFSALTTDLSSGLPAEIQARRKQYEYYRDKLLTIRKAS
jgi:type I restriction enzyme S subunit